MRLIWKRFSFSIFLSGVRGYTFPNMLLNIIPSRRRHNFVPIRFIGNYYFYYNNFIGLLTKVILFRCNSTPLLRFFNLKCFYVSWVVFIRMHKIRALQAAAYKHRLMWQIKKKSIQLNT